MTDQSSQIDLGGNDLIVNSLYVNASASGKAGTLLESGGVITTGTTTVTSASASSLAVGLAGATNPSFKVDSSTASQAAGLSVKGAATGGTVAVAAIDSGSNTNLTINAKGTGTIGIGSVSTGAVTITPATTITGATTHTGAVTFSSSALSTSPSAGVGYATGAGGTVTQATSKVTGVSLNTLSGAITLNNAALAAATIVSFVLTDTSIAATDVLILNHISGGTVGSYTLNAQAAAGSATINVRNNTAGSLSEAIVIQFVVIKGVNA